MKTTSTIDFAEYQAADKDYASLLEQKAQRGTDITNLLQSGRSDDATAQRLATLRAQQDLLTSRESFALAKRSEAATKLFEIAKALAFNELERGIQEKASALVAAIAKALTPFAGQEHALGIATQIAPDMEIGQLIRSLTMSFSVPSSANKCDDVVQFAGSVKGQLAKLAAIEIP